MFRKYHSSRWPCVATSFCFLFLFFLRLPPRAEGKRQKAKRSRKEEGGGKKKEKKGHWQDPLSTPSLARLSPAWERCVCQKAKNLTGGLSPTALKQPIVCLTIQETSKKCVCRGRRRARVLVRVSLFCFYHFFLAVAAGKAFLHFSSSCSSSEVSRPKEKLAVPRDTLVAHFGMDLVEKTWENECEK